MRRHLVAQALIFAAIAVASLVFGYRYIGQDFHLGDGMVVRSVVEDGQGLNSGMRVAYRGVDVGEIVDARLSPGGGQVLLDIRIAQGTRIPASATARVVTSSALGDHYLDIRPEGSGGPYLQAGDELIIPSQYRAVPLDELIGRVASIIETSDADSLERLGASLSEAVDGNGPRLATILDTTATIAVAVRRQAPTLRGLVEEGSPLVSELARRQDSITGAVSAVRDVSEQLLRHQDSLVYLLDHSPAGMQRAQRLLDENRETGAGLLSNMLVVSPVVRERTPAVKAGLVSGPDGLRALSGTVRGDRADFSLVATQGPVCVYPTPRRSVGDESPREAALDLYCPPGENLDQRGSRAAPRPNSDGLSRATRPGTVIGPPVVQDPLLVPTGDEIAQTWIQMMKGRAEHGER